MASSGRIRNALRRGEDALQGGGLRLPYDPVAEAAAELGNRVIADALADGETEDAAHEKGIRAGVKHYLDTPPPGVYAEPLP